MRGFATTSQPQKKSFGSHGINYVFNAMKGGSRGTKFRISLKPKKITYKFKFKKYLKRLLMLLVITRSHSSIHNLELN